MAKKLVFSDLEFISSLDQDLTLSIVEEDKTIDLLNNEAKLRFKIRTSSLLVLDTNVSSFKLDLFAIQNGEREFIASQNTVLNNKTKSKKIVLYVNTDTMDNGVNNFEIEVYNTEHKLVNVYKLELNAFNKPDKVLNPNSQEPTETVPDSVSCDPEVFGDCQLDFLFRKVNFEVVPQKQLSTKIVKNNNQYTVLIPVQGNNTIKKTVVKDSVAIEAPLVSPEFSSITLSPIELSTELNNGKLEFDGTDLYFTANDERIKLGNEVIEGPQGPAGPQGPRGPQGPMGQQGPKASPADLNNATVTNLRLITPRITENAGQGKVLSSDANGNASWTSLAPDTGATELFTASSTTTNTYSKNKYEDVDGMEINSVTLTENDIIKVTFTGTYEVSGKNPDSFSKLRFTFNDTAMGPVKNIRALIDDSSSNYGSPHMVMLKCGNGAGMIAPGTYTVRLQAYGKAGNASNKGEITFGTDNEEYVMYVEVVNN